MMHHIFLYIIMKPKNILSIGEETKELFQKLLSLKVSVFIKNISKEGFQKKLSKNWSFKTLYKEIVEYEKEDSSFGSLKTLEAVLSSHSAENIDLISLKRLIGEDDYIEEVKNESSERLFILNEEDLKDSLCYPFLFEKNLTYNRKRDF